MEGVTIANRHAYDIVMLSDFRYSGGTSASVAEEIQAQARAGYSTGLLHLPGSHLRAAKPFNGRLLDCLRSGLAELAPVDEPIDARLLIIRQPRVFSTPPVRPIDVRADKVLFVMNQGPCDASGEEAYYDLGGVAAQVHALFGDGVVWVPIGPLVRESILRVDPSFPLADEDWHNIIDLDRWAVDRTGFAGDRPVIGRHSREDWKKWPGTAVELLAAYPERDDVRVRVLGGSAAAEDVLGRRPRNWQVFDYNSVDARRFLRFIDFFVYYHHSSWVEAFGRAILEAIASGAVAILPPHFERVFGDAARYCAPADVMGLVQELFADADAYRTQSRLGQQRARERFSYETHERRVRELIGSPPSRAEVPRPRASGRRRPERMLFVSSNGSGLGHLTRLMAVGRRLPSDVEVVVATQSQAVKLVRGEGFLTEYLPSNRFLRSDSNHWNAYLRSRLDDLVAAHDPALVLVDATVPYGGLLSAMEAHEGLPFVWLRRPMWRQGLGLEWLRRGEAYDAVIEPGEFAASVDRGPTVGRGDAAVVDPIVTLDDDELLDREAACAALGLDPARPSALIQLGAGNINDVTSDVAIVAERLLREPDLQVALAQSPISLRDLPVPEGLRVLRTFPMSRFYRAFDFVVSAAGYNSYHELIRFGVPSLLVPNPQTELDDQVARALFAQDMGVALCLQSITTESADRTLGQLLDEGVRRRMRDRCAQVRLPNGAQAAADLVMAIQRQGMPGDSSSPDAPDEFPVAKSA
jgi:UDP:flavonoid glycosyltransferase YjiC (YdhE family)